MNMYTQPMLQENALKDKVAIVTGGGSGLGKAMTKYFLQLGAKVVITSRNLEKLQGTAAELEAETGGKVLCVSCDVRNWDEVEAMKEAAIKEFGRIDILLNIAGGNIPAATLSADQCFFDMDLDGWNKATNLNMNGTVYPSYVFGKVMAKQGSGSIINISSTNGINTYYPMCIDYDASKAALISLTHNLAFEYGPYINVNAIAPGFIGTDNELDGYDEEFLKEEQEKIMVNRYGKPEEVAYLVKFLISDEANFINNTIIRIDGGQKGSC